MIGFRQTKRLEMNSSKSPERILGRGKYLELVDSDGWEFARRHRGPHAVAIVAKTPDNKMVLIEETRRPVDGQVISIPAGLIGDEDVDEKVLQAARREFEEEAGYRAQHWKILLEGPISAGMTSEIVSFVLASGLERVSDGGGVDRESIVVHTIEMTKVHDWLLEQSAAGLLVDHKVYAALYWLMQT